MCGIIGYIGARETQNILANGLEKLEYRGYDSAGIAVCDGECIQTEKTVGRLDSLQEKLIESPKQGSLGIGHTRWATHGRPSNENSHPHTDEETEFAVVHNGIIENYLDVKEELMAEGVTFTSETDSEVIAHLFSKLYDGEMISTIQKVVQKLKGAYALGVVTKNDPDTLYAVRQASPLIVGVGEDENFISSDIPALLEHTRDMLILEDGEIAVLKREGVSLLDLETANPIERDVFKVDWDMEQAEKNGFDHFMLKEIFEQPNALQKTMTGRFDEENNKVDFQELDWTADKVNNWNKIYIVACGTAYHAGLIGQNAIEELTRIPVSVEIASEFRYRRPIIDENTLVIVVSQSGETADTLAALRQSQKVGAEVLGITNVVGSSIAREADNVILTMAGPEIAVASTKAYTTQVLSFYLLGTYVAQMKEMISDEYREKLVKGIQAIPSQIEEGLEHTKGLQWYAESIKDSQSVFFLGRGLDHAVALEGSLKLKEISYIHSEAYAAGELKHGTLALIEEGTPVIALATQDEVYEKMLGNIEEVKARGAQVMGVATEGNMKIYQYVDETCYIPATLSLLTPLLSVVPLQIISYYTALALDKDIDKPRNLAKSVTVE
ncbi:glutamine--fructose-6-phosphate transaminase (isomerizing) [Pontibacillus yanchengensis]|uniref:Glutamine--fructose-6-phosphate transaminase (Isomerizing) n=2 Tax=Pontibacillus yanchengensis TaxID=462910 RepID=A0ACC7VIS0_9BACI|nr:glutamine--fructose-6-phosphate transaminase (isomerizing) [Pontibacillus yanchengensis]MYL34658.1 glutamine--fructose-6-phosphate transaminase (isomerizing) [Pontibacillus yanchengensis]MYL54525.1 glutamine--fructose-6-phosphate transaminase (isomerizing) [Pontibacillus yanchengensis]